MAWTIPTIRATGFLIDAPIWNTEHVGNLVEASTIYTYTPGWGSQSNPQPVLGNGTLTGTYIKLGKLITVRIVLASGSSTTFGTGEWAFTLPLTADAAGSPMPLWIQDVGTALYTGLAYLVSTTSVKLTVNGLGANFLSNGSPFTWNGTSGDNCVILGQYFTASV